MFQLEVFESIASSAAWYHFDAVFSRQESLEETQEPLSAGGHGMVPNPAAFNVD